MIINPKRSNIRLYQALLYSMFSNINIIRSDGNLYQVPTFINSFGQRIKRELEIEFEDYEKAKMGLELPAISIDFLDYMYDPQRALNKMNRKVHLVFSNRRALITYEDIPVILNFQLTIASKTITDSYAIIEGIQSAFRNNYIKKKVKLPLYNNSEILTPIYINAITPLDELSMEEQGGREITVNINLSVKGIVHSYIDGRWKDVLDYYRQFKLIDSDGDGILDAYIHPDCDGVDECGNPTDSETFNPILIGSDRDKTWLKASLEELASLTNTTYTDLLSKPEFDINSIGDPMIEKVLLRVFETESLNNVIGDILIKDEHSN